jgi:perosamine synthetase
MIPVNEPVLDGNELKYLTECISSGWISSEGPFVRKFEEQVAERVNRKFGVAVANGSVALEAAFTAIGLNKGDEVILPTFTIISCIAPIVRLGAIPVLVDANPFTWNMDVDQIESKITSRTKAILVVHIYGLPCELDSIMTLAKKYNLKVIEDAAEAIGQTYKGKPCGSFGDISVLSFYPNKHITTGEGGMILTNNEFLAKRCRELRNLCFVPPRRFLHEELGWNFRMTNLQAAVGVAQLERLDEFIVKKREIGDWYNEFLGETGLLIQRPMERTDYALNIYWVYSIVLKSEVPFDAFEAISKLANVGIGTRPFFYPMHKQPVLKKLGLFADESYPVADNLGERGLYLPSGLSLTKKQAFEVSSKLKQLLNGNI